MFNKYQREISFSLQKQNRQMQNIVKILLSRGATFQEAEDMLMQSSKKVSNMGFKKNHIIVYDDTTSLCLRQVVKSLKKDIEQISEHINIQPMYLEVLLNVLVKENIKMVKHLQEKKGNIRNIQMLLEEINPTKKEVLL